MKSKSLLLIAVCVAAVLTTMGCDPVRPDRRGKLAHPTMTPDEIAKGLDSHVRAVSEGATGGVSGAGGGCGCN